MCVHFNNSFEFAGRLTRGWGKDKEYPTSLCGCSQPQQWRAPVKASDHKLRCPVYQARTQVQAWFVGDRLAVPHPS